MGASSGGCRTSACATYCNTQQTPVKFRSTPVEGSVGLFYKAKHGMQRSAITLLFLAAPFELQVLQFKVEIQIQPSAGWMEGLHTSHKGDAPSWRENIENTHASVLLLPVGPFTPFFTS